MSAVELFVSHSERDEPLVQPLTNWLQSGLGLTNAEIRCTSVSNMAVGSVPAQALREDLISAKAVVGLLTANSLRSHWAQLEMGAGWLQCRLHPVRGPGVYVADLPSPLSDFTTVGYCEKGAMHNLLHQLALALNRPVNPDAEQQFDTIAQSALAALVADMVRWFSLPPVLAAWRLDNARYEYELQSLCMGLGLEPRELRACTTSLGVFTRDPEQLPVWASDLWTLSRNVVNFMLNPASGDRTELLDVPAGILNDRLIADMKHALYARKNRGPRIRQWFSDTRQWITENPPDEHRSHGARGHR